MRIFIDTSAFYALLDRNDANHPQARVAWTSMVEGANSFFTSNYVLVESFALLQHRLGIDAVRGYQEDILPLIHVEFVAPEVHRSGIGALLSASRRNLSFVDCVSFEVMRSLVQLGGSFHPIRDRAIPPSRGAGGCECHRTSPLIPLQRGN